MAETVQRLAGQGAQPRVWDRRTQLRRTGGQEWQTQAGSQADLGSGGPRALVGLSPGPAGAPVCARRGQGPLALQTQQPTALSSAEQIFIETLVAPGTVLPAGNTP